MGNVFKRLCSCLLCFLFLVGMVAVVPAKTAEAAYSNEVETALQTIYAQRYNDIRADYDAGFQHILLFRNESGKCYTIAMSKYPTYLYYASTNHHLGVADVTVSGTTATYKLVSGDNLHYYYLYDGTVYSSAVDGVVFPVSSVGWGDPTWTIYDYYYSNYDIYYFSTGLTGELWYLTYNLPEWFEVGNTSPVSNKIPPCPYVTDYYTEKGNVVYWYYRAQPTYAFCRWSEAPAAVTYHCADDATSEYHTVEWIAEDGTRKKIDSLNCYAVYNAKTGIWTQTTDVFESNLLKDLLPQAAYDNGKLVGSNFALAYTNRELPIYRFDSSGALLDKLDIKSPIYTGNMSFPVAPAPELVGTVQGIMWSKMMTEIVGLIPLLVGLVISFLALRKGLAMLYRRLRKG